MCKKDKSDRKGNEEKLSGQRILKLEDKKKVRERYLHIRMGDISFLMIVFLGGGGGVFGDGPPLPPSWAKLYVGCCSRVELSVSISQDLWSIVIKSIRG